MPWSDFKGHSHWGLVRWIPFGDHRLALSEIVGNVALFLPFGLLLFYGCGTEISTGNDPVWFGGVSPAFNWGRVLPGFLSRSSLLHYGRLN